MSDGFECDDCGKSFDTKRGLNIHRSQVHPDEETETSVEKDTGEAAEENSTGYNLSLGFREVVATSFAGGLVLGVLLTALFFTASGLTMTGPQTGSADSITAKVDGVSGSTISKMMEQNREKYTTEISKDRAEGNTAGITGTPGFAIYSSGSTTGRKLVGAQPYQNFQTVIENKLNGGSAGNVSTAVFETENEPSIGQEDAPVTIVYWYDYQCPFCKRFEQQTLSQIKKNYVDTGKARIVFKNFAFLGEDSRTAAIASEAVWEKYPNKWFDWHTTVFDNQGPERSGWASKENLLGS